MYNLFMNSNLGYLLQIIPFILLVGTIYSIVRYIWLKKRSLSKNGWGNEATRLLLVCYIAGLLSLVWVPANFWSSIWYYVLNGYSGGSMGKLFSGEFNFIPSMFRYFTGELVGAGSWTQFMAVGNILMYLPFGLLVPFLWKRLNWWKMVLTGFAVSAITELGQPIFGRSFDVDDLISNTIGVLIGFLIFVIVRFIAPKFVNR